MCKNCSEIASINSFSFIQILNFFLSEIISFVFAFVGLFVVGRVMRSMNPCSFLQNAFLYALALCTRTQTESEEIVSQLYIRLTDLVAHDAEEFSKLAQCSGRILLQNQRLFKYIEFSSLSHVSV